MKFLHWLKLAFTPLTRRDYLLAYRTELQIRKIEAEGQVKFYHYALSETDALLRLTEQ